MRSLENELEQFKRQVGENNHKKIDDMKLKTKLKVIEDKQKVLATPIEYGKCKDRSVSKFIDSIAICMSDLKTTEDGFVEITGEQINNKKKEMGLKKIDAPRGVNDEDIILSKRKH
jgi:benzoyl-CoA reductase/2-hydroxyglutaryl-CoA dehydratase subunit BcrC/BadD/HgdB